MNKILKITIAVVLIVLFASSFVEKKNGETHLNDMNCIALLELAADYAYSKIKKTNMTSLKKRSSIFINPIPMVICSLIKLGGIKLNIKLD